MSRFIRSRASAAFFAVTLVGVAAIGTASASAPWALNWSLTGSPQASFIPPLSGNTPQLADAGTDLAAVSCTSPMFCVAVGVGNNSAGGPTLVDEWHGRRWIASPRSSVAGQSSLTGVSCVRTRFCMAVGSTGDHQPIVEKFNGVGWSYTLLDPFPAHPQTRLTGVSCTSTTFCAAVGSTTDGTTQTTFVERWSGAGWSVVPSPNSGTGNNALFGVSCRNEIFCVAVGAFATATDTQPLIERWNGSAWAVAPTPSLGAGTFAQLASISCVSSRFCMATGSQLAAPLVETWNGSAWSLGAIPPARVGFSQAFTGVSCLRTHHCVATLQEAGPTSASTGAVVQEWTGTAWTSGRGAPGTSGLLHGVSCSGNRFCFAVGGSHYFPEGSVALRGV